MADLNALIAQGAQFQAPVDPFAQYGKMQQLQQGQQANQLNQMKMQEMQAANTERNALRQLDPTSPDYENQLFKVNPTMGIAYRKEAATAAAQQATQQAQKAQALKTNLDNHRSFLVGVNDQPSYDAWRTLTAQNIPELASILPAQFSAEVKDSLLKKADDVSKQLTAPPSYHSAAPGATVLQNGVPIYTAPVAPEKTKQTDLQINYQAAKDQGFVGSIFDYERKLKEAGRAPAAPRPEQPLEKVVDPVTGKIVFASRDEALRGRMTPASAMEGLAPKEIQNREAKYPVAKRATATVSATMTEIENTIDRLLANEKGLNGITGFVGGRTFALTNEARKAEADLKQLKNLAFVQGLTELRNASSTGAGVGNVSNKEGDRFENLKASLEQTQSTDDLKASLKRLKSQSTATRDTVNQAFEDTYAYRANAPAAAAKPSGGGAPPPPPGFKPD
jgi:hypothetical protein